MTATSFAGISEISTEVADLLLTKDVKYLYTIEATFGVNDANWGDGSPFAMIDGKRYQVNGSYAFKVTEVSYDEEDEVYAEEKKKYPKIGTIVNRDGKKGKVISIDIFRKSYRVETEDKDVIEIFLDESNK